jgi:hypothetical protein
MKLPSLDEESRRVDDSEPIGSVPIIAANFEQPTLQSAKPQFSRDLNLQIAELERKNSELESKNAELQQITIEQSDAINDLKCSNESLIKKNETLSQEIKFKDKLNEEFQKEIKALQTRVGELTTDNELIEKYRPQAMAEDLKSSKQEAANHQSSSTGSESRSASAYALSKTSAPLITKSIFDMIGSAIIPSPAKATTSILQPTTELSFSKRSQSSDSPSKKNTSPAKPPEVKLSSKDKLGEFQSSEATSQFHARSIDGSDRVSKDLPDTSVNYYSHDSSKQGDDSSLQSLLNFEETLERSLPKIKKDLELKEFNFKIKRNLEKHRSSISSAGIIFEMSIDKELQITKVENGANTKEEMTERLYGYFINQSLNFFEKDIDVKKFIEHFSSQDIKVKGEIEEDLQGFLDYFKKIKESKKSTGPATASTRTSVRSLKFGNANQDSLSEGSSR